MISQPKHNILLAINRFSYLSAPQVTRFVYGTKVLKYVRQLLKELREDGYIQPVYLPRTAPGGKSLSIYCLDNRGVRYIRSVGRIPLPRSTTREWFFLAHTLAANDLVITCHQLDQVDGFSLQAFRTERDLKQRLKVIPDGWVHLMRQWPNRPTPNHHFLTFELDRGTVEQRAFRKKLSALVRWVDDPNGYEKDLGVSGVNIAFVTTESPKRLENILRWSEEELKDSHYADLFLFSHFDPSTINPLELVLSPIWRQPFCDKPTTLLEPPAS